MDKLSSINDMIQLTDYTFYEEVLNEDDVHHIIITIIVIVCLCVCVCIGVDSIASEY